MVHEANLQRQHYLGHNAKPPSLSTKTIMKLGSSFCNIEPDLLSCEVRPVQQEEGNAPMGVGSSKSNKHKKPNEEEDKNNNKIIETLPSKKIIQTPSSDVFLSPRSLCFFESLVRVCLLESLVRSDSFGLNCCFVREAFQSWALICA